MNGLAIFLNLLLGLPIAYLGFVFRYVPPPFCWVIELNFPGMETKKIIWNPGIHFLWFPIKPFMFVRNKVSLADQKITLTMGVNDGNPGLPSLVEVSDTAVMIHVQLIIRVIDPLLATYAISNGDAITAAVNMIEGSLRRRLSGLELKDAMGDKCRTEIAQKITQEVNGAIASWGIKLIKPEDKQDGEALTILDFMLTPEDLEARAKVLAADSAAKAAVNAAKGTKEATILVAQGEAEKIRLALEATGKGEAEKIQVIATALKVDEKTVRDYLLNQGLIGALSSSTFFATKGGFEEMLAGILSGAKSIVPKT